jgi:preprotein translocase subunit SecD
MRVVASIAGLAAGGMLCCGCGGGADAGPGVTLRFAAPAGAHVDTTVVRDRLARLGVGGATVRRSGDRLVVSAPDLSAADARPLARQLASPSPLRFFDWEASVVGPGCKLRPADTAVTGGERAGSPDFGLTAGAARARAAACPDTIVVRARGVDADRWYVLRDDPAVTGTEVRRPKAFRDSGATGTGESKVTFDFTPAGVRDWQALTRTVARRDRAAAASGGDPQHVAIVLDDVLLSTPSIAYRDYPDGIDATFGAQIDGGLTERTARELAALVTGGTLPAPLRLIGSSPP